MVAWTNWIGVVEEWLTGLACGSQVGVVVMHLAKIRAVSRYGTVRLNVLDLLGEDAESRANHEALHRLPSQC